MTLLTPRVLGSTGLTISSITIGAAAWHSLSDPPATSPEDSLALARAAFAHPIINAIDTSNNYGAGQSERRIGVAIGENGGLPEGFLLSTKADRDMVTGSFTGERMLRSLEESLARLGIDRFPLLFLHDPENIPWSQAVASRGPLAALVAAREQGLIEHLGISGGQAPLLARFVELGEFSALITHNRYTLLDRSADELITLAADRGLGVFNAAPYGGGILTRFPPTTTRYAYGEASRPMLASAHAFGDIAARVGVPLAALALQFSLRDPRIHSTIVGMRSVEDLRSTESLVECEIPDAVWRDAEMVELDMSAWQDPR